MKRMHIHVGVDNLEKSIGFYNILFGSEPAKVKSDYAKWMLDDPKINFAISTRADKGVDHLGLQVETDNELQEIRDRIKNADLSVFDEGEAVCCYAKSDKSWVEDPAGIAWEAYNSMQDVELFSDVEKEGENACCTPETKGTPDCCEPTERDKECC